MGDFVKVRVKYNISTDAGDKDTYDISTEICVSDLAHIRGLVNAYFDSMVEELEILGDT